MKNFALGNVVNYVRYHYTTQYKLYLTLVLQMLLIPLFFGIISREADVAYAISIVIYVFGTLSLSRTMVLPMRDRGMKIMEMTVPVSSVERMWVILLNGLVLYPIVAFLVGVLAVTLSTPFHYGEFDLIGQIKEMVVDNYFFWGTYVFIQIMFSGSLIINLLARRNLAIAYLVAFVIMVAFVIVVARAGVEVFVRFEDQLRSIETWYLPQWLGVTIYSLIPTTMYAICYILLRKRQVKW